MVRGDAGRGLAEQMQGASVSGQAHVRARGGETLLYR